MALVLVLLFIVGPIVELYVIIQVADVIGGWQTVGLLVVESFIGAWLMKRQGVGAVQRIQTDLAAYRMPTRSLADGFLILFAGVLLLTPGFLTDILGFVLLIPFTRAPIRAVLMRTLTRRLGTGVGVLRYVDGSGAGFTRSRGGVYDATARPADGTDAGFDTTPGPAPDEVHRPEILPGDERRRT
jgi:UPF0716 protein FxsA